MFTLLATVFFVVLAGSSVTANINDRYCEAGLCRAGNQHIGCGHTGEFDPSCPPDRYLLHFTEADRQAVLNAHNANRNRIASGAEPGLMSASRMATMTWSFELADLAELNVKQCQMRHDSCRNTREFPFAGQNVAMRSRTDIFLPLGALVQDVIDGWYSQVRHVTQPDIDRCCESSSGSTIGHFTQVVTDRSIQVGCAVSRYTTVTTATWRNSLMVCNYAFVNLVGERVFVTGPVASGCVTGVNSNFPALCSVNEPIRAAL